MAGPRAAAAPAAKPAGAQVGARPADPFTDRNTAATVLKPATTPAAQRAILGGVSILAAVADKKEAAGRLAADFVRAALARGGINAKATCNKSIEAVGSPSRSGDPTATAAL